MKIEAIRDVLQIARDMHGSNDKLLPKVIKLSHAKVACALSRKLSVQASSVYAGVSLRSVHRYVKSPAMQDTVLDIIRGRLDGSVSRETFDNVEDIYEVLLCKAREGDMTGIKEVLRLVGRGGSEGRASDEATTTASSGYIRTTPTLEYDNALPPATSTKAEEHPSPPPEYLDVIAPVWSVGPVSENESARLALDLTDQSDDEH